MKFTHGQAVCAVDTFRAISPGGVFLFDVVRGDLMSIISHDSTRAFHWGMKAIIVINDVSVLTKWVYAIEDGSGARMNNVFIEEWFGENQKLLKAERYEI